MWSQKTLGGEDTRGKRKNPTRSCCGQLAFTSIVSPGSHCGTLPPLPPGRSEGLGPHTPALLSLAAGCPWGRPPPHSSPCQEQGREARRVRPKRWEGRRRHSMRPVSVALLDGVCQLRRHTPGGHPRRTLIGFHADPGRGSTWRRPKLIIITPPPRGDWFPVSTAGNPGQ